MWKNVAFLAMECVVCARCARVVLPAGAWLAPPSAGGGVRSAVGRLPSGAWLSPPSGGDRAALRIVLEFCVTVAWWLKKQKVHVSGCGCAAPGPPAIRTPGISPIRRLRALSLCGWMPHKRRAEKEARRLDVKRARRIATIVQKLLEDALYIKQDHDTTAEQRAEAVQYLVNVVTDAASSSQRSRSPSPVSPDADGPGAWDRWIF